MSCQEHCALIASGRQERCLSPEHCTVEHTDQLVCLHRGNSDPRCALTLHCFIDKQCAPSSCSRRAAISSSSVSRITAWLHFERKRNVLNTWFVAGQRVSGDQRTRCSPTFSINWLIAHRAFSPRAAISRRWMTGCSLASSSRPAMCVRARAWRLSVRALHASWPTLGTA